MRIVAIHAGHDSNACVYDEGKVEKYILTERFTGKKHDSNIYSLLPEFLSSQPEVDYFLISGESEIADLISKHYRYPVHGPWSPPDYDKGADIIVVNGHHQHHADLAYWNSGFDKCIAVVVDSQGHYVNRDANDLVESESIYVYDGVKRPSRVYKSVIRDVLEKDVTGRKFEKIQTQYSHKNNLGLGAFYDFAAKYIGGSTDDCGKAMALAAYGEPTPKYKFFLKGNTFNNEGAFDHYDGDRAKEITNANHKKYADFCYETQRQTEKALGDLIQSAVVSTGIKKVCVSGGYAMNVVANYYLTQRFPDVDFYFEPMCGDSGLSIAYAMNHYFLENVDFADCPCGGVPEPLGTTFLHGEVYKNDYVGEKKNLKDIAKLLYSDKSVAVYRGLAEAGQRALGNRSILFNPLNRKAKEIVNKIKKREWYRPFAAVVLEEDAHLFFDNVIPNEYMTMCFPVNKGLGLMIPGVTHVDKTCRVQTVSSGYLYELLKEFKELSGYGILLNTSLNLAGDPLVETPEQAVSLLKNSSLDHLWFADTGQML